MKRWWLMAIVPCLAVDAHAAVHTETLEYQDGDAPLEGVVAYDDAQTGKRPGILVVPDWMGMGDYVKRRAAQLAGLGYIAFACDIYGKGVRPQNAKEAGQQAGRFKADRALLRSRVRAGLTVLKNQLRCDQQRVAAIGYCFGGLTVLELARSGADIAGVVSFHGSLDTPTPEDARNIKAKVLALHGADDPYVPPADVAAFQDEMRKGGVDWQMTSYGGAVHSFTKPETGTNVASGAAYDVKADRRSWEAMKVFFAEILH